MREPYGESPVQTLRRAYAAPRSVGKSTLYGRRPRQMFVDELVGWPGDKDVVAESARLTHHDTGAAVVRLSVYRLPG